MALLLDAVVALMQIGLLAFLAWGGWLAARSQLPEARIRQAPRALRPVALMTREHDFERVASLVLLALFFTTFLAAA